MERKRSTSAIGKGVRRNKTPNEKDEFEESQSINNINKNID